MKTYQTPSRFRPLERHFVPTVHEWAASYLGRVSIGEQENGAVMTELTDCLIEDAMPRTLR